MPPNPPTEFNRQKNRGKEASHAHCFRQGRPDFRLPLIRTLHPSPLLWATIFAYAVDKEVDLAAGGAVVDVELLLVHEELADFAENSPAGALMKPLGAGEGQGNVAGRASRGVGGHGRIFTSSGGVRLL